MQALDGIRIIEIAPLVAAPMAGRLLADWGADVIHIEHPSRGDMLRFFQAGQGGSAGVPSKVNYTWENYNRDKRSVAVDLSLPAGQQIIYRLVEQSDVLLSVLRPYELEKYKLDYTTLSRVNSKLIFASLTGYGRQGPEKNTPGFDATAYWARTGMPKMMLAAGFRAAFGDNMTGLMMAYGIMLALFARERTGIGQEVDTSLFNTGVFQLSFDMAGALVEKREFGDWVEENLNPMIGMFETKDAREVFLVALQPDLYWSKFCQAIEQPELEHDARFESFEARARNRDVLTAIMRQVFLTKTLDQWKVRLVGIPTAPIQKLLEVISDPQARAAGFFVPFNHPVYGMIEMLANPVKLSKTPSIIRKRAPEFGEHTEEALLEVGYTWGDITKFKKDNVIP